MIRLSVTVAMCTHRRHEQLRNTFDTYLNQTRKPEQIVVVEDGYDDGLTKDICKRYADLLPIEWLCRRNRPNLGFSNSAVPRNIGIQAASGDIVVIQNPEVKFTKPTDFENIINPVELNPMLSCCAPCESLNPDGSHMSWYADPKLDCNYNHFCQAYRKTHIIAIGGFDERFIGYGWEDHDFNWRMKYENTGIRTVWAEDVIVQHQWHPQFGNPDNKIHETFNIALHSQNIQDILGGKRTCEANIGSRWGDVNS